MTERIASRENQQIKQAVRLRESTSERRERGLFFLEGYRLCADALASGYVPEALFMTEAALRKYPTASLWLRECSAPREAVSDLNVTIISEAVAEKLADTQNPQGVFGIFAARATCGGAPRFASLNEGRYLALEKLQNPDNLGAIARTAEALAIDGLVISGGCDVYHPKALRASMGALLRLPVRRVESLPDTLRASALPSYAAVANANATPIPQCDFSRGGIVVIGNEGNGLSEGALAACEYQITIPMAGNAESLNAAAAAAIVMWEMVRHPGAAALRALRPQASALASEGGLI